MALNILSSSEGSSSNFPRSLLIEVVLLLAVSGLFYWFIVQPKQSELGGLKDTLAATDEQKKQTAEQKDKLAGLISQLQQSKNELALLDQAIPLSERLINLKLYLNFLVGRSGMTIGDISISAGGDEIVAGNKDLLAKPFGPTRSVKLITGSINVTGNVAQFQGLLRKIEDNLRVIDITNVSASSAGNSAALDQLSFRLTIQTYSYE